MSATPDLNLLPVFEALLRHGNVTRAAAQMGLTQSAMSSALGGREAFDPRRSCATRSAARAFSRSATCA